MIQRCGHPLGARMIVPAGGLLATGCWACGVEQEIAEGRSPGTFVSHHAEPLAPGSRFCRSCQRMIRRDAGSSSGWRHVGAN